MLQQLISQQINVVFCKQLTPAPQKSKKKKKNTVSIWTKKGPEWILSRA